MQTSAQEVHVKHVTQPLVANRRTSTSRALHDDELERARASQRVDEVLEGSFPASDPPPWTCTRSGPPKHGGP
jgi:hypothetical protein